MTTPVVEAPPVDPAEAEEEAVPRRRPQWTEEERARINARREKRRRRSVAIPDAEAEQLAEPARQALQQYRRAQAATRRAEATEQRKLEALAAAAYQASEAGLGHNRLAKLLRVEHRSWVQKLVERKLRQLAARAAQRLTPEQVDELTGGRGIDRAQVEQLRDLLAAAGDGLPTE